MQKKLFCVMIFFSIFSSIDSKGESLNIKDCLPLHVGYINNFSTTLNTVVTEGSFEPFIFDQVFHRNMYFLNAFRRTEFYKYDASDNLSMYGFHEYETGIDSYFTYIYDPPINFQASMEIGTTYTSNHTFTKYDQNFNVIYAIPVVIETILTGPHSVIVASGNYDTYKIEILITFPDNSTALKEYWLDDKIGYIKVQEDGIYYGLLSYYIVGMVENHLRPNPNFLYHNDFSNYPSRWHNDWGVMQATDDNTILHASTTKVNGDALLSPYYWTKGTKILIECDIKINFPIIFEDYYWARIVWGHVFDRNDPFYNRAYRYFSISWDDLYTGSFYEYNDPQNGVAAGGICHSSNTDISIAAENWYKIKLFVEADGTVQSYIDNEFYGRHAGVDEYTSEGFVGVLANGETDIEFDNFKVIGMIGLRDAILALRTCAGLTNDDASSAVADVNGDNSVGVSEAIYILQVVAQ